MRNGIVFGVAGLVLARLLAAALDRRRSVSRSSRAAATYPVRRHSWLPDPWTGQWALR